MKLKYPKIIRKLSDSEQFCHVFKQLVLDKVDTIITNELAGVVEINFKDGSKCGALVPWINAGFEDLGDIIRCDGDFSDDEYGYE